MPTQTTRRKPKSKTKTAVSKFKSFVFKQSLTVAPAEAFRAFTHPTALRDWFCDMAQVEARKGGKIALGWNSGYYACGEFLTFEPGKKLVFTWDGKGEPEPTRVAIAFAAKGPGTQVTVSHTGLGSGAKWAGAIQEVQRSWPTSLENLKSVLEAGIDLRFARRPRLGIFIGEFDAQVAKKLGVPAKDGIRLEGTAEGSGARAVGLQKDDVIVKFGGKSVNVVTLGEAVTHYQAGDKVPVAFYRGSEKQTVLLELSRFPIPEVPATAEVLAERARQNYAEIESELVKMVEGLTEAEAGHKEGSEWSVKEMIAHYIACERDFQSWLAAMLRDNPIEDDLQYRPNVDERLRALVARFATMPALLEELKQAENETVALLTNLPPAFLARKHLYRRAASWMLEVLPEHFHGEHNMQLRAAIAAAKPKEIN